MNCGQCIVTVELKTSMEKNMGLEYTDEKWATRIDNVRIQILKEEIDYYKTLIESQDCGHIHTTISFLESRIENLLGGEKVWPFKK